MNTRPSECSGPRQVVARTVSRTGVYKVGQWLLGHARGGFILAYHNLPTQRFFEQIEALAPNRPVSLDELASRTRAGRSTAGLMAITFDDGVGETVRDIAAACRGRGWPVTFYLPTAYLTDPSGMPFQWMTALSRHLPPRRIELAGRQLDLSQPGKPQLFLRDLEERMHTQPASSYAPLLRELCDYLVSTGVAPADALRAPAPITWAEVTDLARDASISFESHGVSHAALSSMSDQEMDRELLTSRDAISERTGRPCRHFCYPFGNSAAIGPHGAERVERFYETGTTMTRGRVRGHRLALLPRIPIYEQDSAEVARLKVLTA